MNLSSIPNEALEAELESRKKASREAAKPRQIENPDLTKLRRICQEYIDCKDTSAYCDDDFGHWIYEAALMAFFGKDVFSWINEQE